MSCLKVVVFDCDGVILESVDAKTRAFAASVADYGPEAQQWLVGLHMRHGGISRHEKYRRFYEEYLGKPAGKADIDALADRFADLSLTEVQNSPFVAGALETIEALSDRAPLYVVSGAPEVELREIFRLRGLTPHFRGVYGSPRKKPELLRMILEAEGVDPDEAIMIGDSSTDLEAARAVGTAFYGRDDGCAFPGEVCAPDLSGLLEYITARLCPGS